MIKSHVENIPVKAEKLNCKLWQHMIYNNGHWYVESQSNSKLMTEIISLCYHLRYIIMVTDMLSARVTANSWQK